MWAQVAADSKLEAAKAEQLAQEEKNKGAKAEQFAKAEQLAEAKVVKELKELKLAKVVKEVNVAAKGRESEKQQPRKEELVGAQWHPRDAAIFLTASNSGVLRLYDTRTSSVVGSPALRTLGRDTPRRSQTRAFSSPRTSPSLSFSLFHSSEISFAFAYCTSKSCCTRISLDPI